jgi:hypothetical protein
MPTFTAPIPPHAHHGLKGGMATLMLDADAFTLTLERAYLPDRDDTDTLIGTASRTAEGWQLHATQHASVAWETERQASTRQVTRTLLARETPRGLELAFDLGPERFALVLRPAP